MAAVPKIPPHKLKKKKKLVAGFPPRRPGFRHGFSRVGFVVDKVALGQVFSEYFSLHSTNFSTITITYHPGLVQ
jgi:hypothetical protein